MEPINWHAMTPAQRDQLMVEKVLGYSLQGQVDIPRSSQSMDAAWLVLQEMAKRKQPKFQPFTLFVEAMLAASGWDNASAWSEIYPAYEIFIMAAVRWTPETICIAALKGCGYTVLTEEVS